MGLVIIVCQVAGGLLGIFSWTALMRQPAGGAEDGGAADADDGV